MRSYLLTTVAVGAIAAFGVIGAAHANPANPTSPSPVVNQPTYSGLGTNNLQVNLNQPRTIIDWGSYNIASGDKTSYIFGAGNNSWIVLNRVNSGSATISGTLQGCLADCTTFGGNIWIYASDGVVIGNGAVVNTGGFLATTSPLGMTDSAFATGTGNSFSFGAANAGTSVQIQGNAQINGNGGTLAFIAPQVSTDAGTTVSTSGKGSSVLYGAATSYTLQFAPDTAGDFDLITFDVPAAGSSGGSTSTTPITINGATKAGNVYVAAVTQSSVANAMISISGTQTATQASAGVDGDIVLSAGGGIANGAAAAPSSGGPGGAVGATISGNLQADTQVSLNASASIDASGAAITGASANGGSNLSTTLFGSSAGGATITNSANQIGNVAGFTNTGSGDVNISSSTAMDVTGAVDSGSGNIALTSAGSMSLSGNLTAGVASGSQTISLDAAGSISESNYAVITAGELTGSSVGPTRLTDANLVGTLGSFSASGSFSFTDAQALTVAGPVTVTGGDGSNLLSLVTTSGDITLDGNLTAGAASGAHNALTLNSADAIEQTGGTITAGRIETSSIGDTSLTQSGNAIGTFAAAFAGGNLYLVDGSALTVTGSLTAGTAGQGNIFLESKSPLGITFNGGDGSIGITAGPGGAVSLEADALTFTNATTVTAGLFEYAPFTVGAPVTLGAGGVFPSDNLNFVDVGAVRIGAITKPGQSAPTTTAGSITIAPGGFDAGGINLELDAQGAITQTGALTGVAALTGNADSVALTNTANAIAEVGNFTTTGDFALSDSNALSTTGTLLSTGGNISLTTTSGDITLGGNLFASGTGSQSVTLVSAGGISQTNGLIIADELTGSSAVDTSLTQTSNMIGTLDAFQAGGNFSLTNGQALTVNGAVSAGTGNLTLVAAGPSGNIITIANGGSLTAQGSGSQAVILGAVGGDITETGGTITADELTAFSTGNVTLTGANQVARLEAVRTTGNFALSNTTALTVDGSNVTTSLPSNTGIVAGSGGTGNIYIAAPSITFSSASSSVGLIASNDSLISIQADQLSFPTQTGFLSSGGTFEYAPYTQGGTATLGGTGGLINNNVYLDVDHVRVGAVTEPGSSNPTATAGTISIPGQFFLGTNQSLELDTTASGVVSETTSGLLFVSTLTGNAGTVTLDSGNLIGTLGTFTTADGFSLANAQALTVNGAVNAGTGNLALQTTSAGTLTIAAGGSLTATGSGSQVVILSGLGGDITETGGTITADELTAFSTGDITLMGGNAVNTLEAVQAFGKFDLFDTRALTVDGSSISSLPGLATAGIAAGSSGTGNVYIGSSNPAGITFSGAGGGVLIQSEVSTGGIISIQADQVSFSTATAFVAPHGTFEFAPYTADTAVTLGTGGELPGSNTAFVTNLIRVGAVTEPGASSPTTTAGTISIEGAFTTQNIALELDAMGAITEASFAELIAPKLTGNAAAVTLTNSNNSIGSLGDFTATGAFALADSTPLSITGTLSAGSTDLSSSGTITFSGGAVTTSGAQTYDGAVALGADTTLTSTGGSVSFTSTVDGAHALTIDGAAGFGGAIGSTTALAGLTVTGASTLAGATVNTTGAQDYQGSVGLGANTTLTSNASGNITFGSTVDGAFSLAVNTTGMTTFDGDIGDTTKLTGLAISGPSTLDGTITTTGDQTYSSAVTLISDENFISTGAGNITFNSTIDGPYALYVSTAGVTTFGGAIGGTTPLSSVTTDAAGSTLINGGAVKTTGAQTYNNAIILGADTSLTSTGNGAIDFASTVDGAFGLTVDTAGQTTFGGTVGGTTALTGLTTDAAGSTAINGGAITTSGAQTYNDAVTLGAGTTLSSTGSGAITFGSTVNGAYSLAVNTAGTTTFGGAVGGTTALTSLTTDAAGLTAINGGAVTTTGAQTYNNAVILGAGTMLTSTGSGNITLGSTVDGPFALTVNTAGQTTFGGAIGGTTALTSLTTDAAGTTAINGGAVTTTGAQTYKDAVTLGAGTTLSSTGSGAITLGSTFDGAYSLTTNTAGVTTFGGAVGGTTALTSLTTDAAGSTAINGGSVTTTGAQTYSNAVALGADTTLTSTGSGAIGFGSTVDGAYALVVNTGGLTAISGAVGGTTALTSLTTDAAGSTIINGGTVTTTGTQTYNDAVALGADATLKASSVDFDSTVDGPYKLTITGDAAFHHSVGGALALTSISVSGTTTLDGTVKTSGGQTYSDPVILASDQTLISTGGGAIVFDSTVNGAFGLTVNTAGATTFDAAVGGTTPLTSLTVNTGSLSLAGNVTTVNNQSYTVTGSGNALTVPSGVTLDSENGSVALVTQTPATDIDLAGSLSATSGTVTLSAAGNIDQTGGTITAATLAPSAGGNVTLGSTSNAVATLTGFADATGSFSLTDSVPLTITGTLSVNALTLNDIGGGIDASAAAITANDLSGSATGNVLFTDASNAIGTLGGFTNAGFSFSLTDTVPLTIAGTLDPTIVTLVNTGGGIDASGGAIIADELTGSAAGDALITNPGNQIGTLEAFRTTGNLSVTDSVALTVAGQDVSGLGFTDVTAGFGATSGNLTLTTLGAGNGITLASNLTASSGNTQVVTLTSAGAINQTSGTITADQLTGSSAGDTTLNDANTVLILEAFQAGGNFSLTNGQALTVGGNVAAGFGNTTGNLSLTTNVGDIGLGADLTAPETVTLVSAGGISQTAGVITANQLTGSAAGSVALGDTNMLGTLAGFSVSGGNSLSLVDGEALTVSGTLSDANGTTTLQSTSGGITVAGSIAAYNLSFNSAAGINESAGAITVHSLGATSASDETFTGDNQIAQLSDVNVSTSGNFTLADNASLILFGNIQAPGNIFIQTASGQSFKTAGPGNALISTGGNLVSLQTDAFSVGSGLTISGSTFELAPTSAGATVTLGASATNLGAAALNVGTVRIGAVTEPGDTNPTTTAGGITFAGDQNFHGDSVDLETTGAVGGPGAVTGIATLSGNAASFDLSNSSNSIQFLGNFSTNGNFTLADGENLSITGALNVGDNAVDLELGTHTLDEAGGTGSITAGALSGNAGAATLNGANRIATLGSFATGSGNVTLDDTVPLTITGMLNAGDGTVDLELGTQSLSENGAGLIEAGELTGAAGAANLTGQNQIATLGNFTITSDGGFMLDNKVALSIIGTLSASGNVVDLELGANAVNENGGEGAIVAQELTGHSGQATLNGGNAVNTLANYTTSSGGFTLDNTVPLTITGTLNASGQTVTLVGAASEGSIGITEGEGGAIEAATLTGSSTGNVSLTNDTNEINTLGDFTNNNGAFSLTDSVPLTVNGALNATGQTVTLTDTGGLVDFATTVNGAFTLDIVGNAEFDDEVGKTAPLSALHVTGTTNINTDLIDTRGTQLYSGAVTLSSDTSLEGSTVTLGSTLDGAHNFGVDGNAVFDGEVGQDAPLRLLVVTGTADINTDKITTTVEQDYEGPVTLSSNTTLTVATGDINFDSTIDGDYALTLNATGSLGVVSFNDAIGNDVPLASLTINAAKAELLSPNIASIGNSITTVGTQVYNAPVLLYANNVLTASTVTFADTVDAPLPRSLAITGNAVFDGAIGSSQAPSSLSVSGTTALNGGSVTTTGSQTYGGGVTLGVDDTLTSTSGNVDFVSTVDGDEALTVNATAGTTTFGAAVGGSTPLTTLTVDTGALSVGDNITTSGNQQITSVSALTVPSDDTLNSTGGNITLVTGAGAILLNGNLTTNGQTVTLNSAGAITQASDSSITTGTLTGAAGGATTLTSSGNTIATLTNFTNTSGAFSLTDSIPLTITGTLNAAGQTVALNDTGGGVDASEGVIDAATLTGSANGDALFTNSENAISNFANFVDNNGNVSLVDNVALTITGTIDPAVLTLVDTGGGIDASGAALIAQELTGSTAGNAVFTNAGNKIGSLGNFTNTQGSFSLTDSAALKITGTLNAAGQAVTLVDTATGAPITIPGDGEDGSLVVSGTGIDASAGTIIAASLSGSTTGVARFTNSENAIGTLAGFSNASGDFSLTDSTSLTITGTLGAAGHTVTLVDTGGSIDANAGVIDTATLTGSAAGDASFTGNNAIDTLDAFQTGGNFSLTDTSALTVSGGDISEQGFTGVTAGHGRSTGDLTVAVNGAALTLAGDLTAGGTGGAEKISLSATGDITQNSGTLTAGTITLSSGGNIARNDGAIDAGTATLTAAGNYTQTGGTIDAHALASLTATSGNIIINAGQINSGDMVALTAGQNILIGEAAFTTAALARAPGTINQVNDPLLPVNTDAAGNVFEASAAYHNYVFITGQTLEVTAPDRIVSENTGTLPATLSGYKPNGIVLNQTITPFPTAVLIDGGAGSGMRPQVVDLFGTLTQGPRDVGAQDIADSAQILFGPDSAKDNAYQINGCIIHNLNSCTIVSFTIKIMDPAKQADLVIIPNGDQDTDELDLTISGEGNDEIWEDEQ